MRPRNPRWPRDRSGTERTRSRPCCSSQRRPQPDRGSHDGSAAPRTRADTKAGLGTVDDVRLASRPDASARPAPGEGRAISPMQVSCVCLELPALHVSWRRRPRTCFARKARLCGRSSRSRRTGPPLHRRRRERADPVRVARTALVQAPTGERRRRRSLPEDGPERPAPNATLLLSWRRVRPPGEHGCL
jgi:hypothetical protein